MLRQLWRLTRAVGGEGTGMSAPAVYAERRVDGWRIEHAKETGYEGVACVDDAARLAVLLLGAYERHRFPGALAWAEGTLEFVKHMQQPDGSFANFVLDWKGAPNLTGPTSHPGGLAWLSRAMRALARAYKVIGVEEYRERYYAALERLPREIPYRDVTAVAVLSGLEMHEARPDPELLDLIGEWCAQIMSCMQNGVLLNEPQHPRPHLWGFIQPAALCRASTALAVPEWVEPARTTASAYLEPIVEQQFRWRRTMPYDVSSTVMNFDALHAATGESRYRALAGQSRAWFHGRNATSEPVYDPLRGMVFDGIDGDRVNLNSGAESNIEGALALFDELPWHEYRFR